MFPQWAPEPMRPLGAVTSRALWKIEFSGVENIPATGGVIVAANHQTYIDPFWLSLKIKRPIRYLAWSAAFRWPLVGQCLTALGAGPPNNEGVYLDPRRRSLQW